MNKQQTITINGVAYDAHTGMRRGDAPVSQAIAVKQVPKHSHAVHAHLQHSTTLKRAHVTAPKPKVVHARPHAAVVHKSPLISKFATTNVAVQVKKPATSVARDIAPVRHPLQNAVSVKRPAAHAPHHQPKAAHVIKDHVIAEAMAKAKPHKKAPKLSLLKRHPRLFSATSAALVVVFLAGYLTYINLPGISVHVAAIQAGINATLPSYHPSGYNLNGPVAYSSGEVSMDFAANASSNKFTLKQSKSSWDSESLLQNLVSKKVGDDYAAFSEKGLTLYVYGNDAAWVNDGILHTIQSTATLSNEQLRKIATSM